MLMDKSQEKNFHPDFKTIYTPIESPNCVFCANWNEIPRVILLIE